jgi:chemotaxis protein CheC
MKILVVDDSKITRKYITKRIPEGFEIYEGSNGKEAFDIYREINPDIVFLDLTMPVMDGYAALEKIKEYDVDAFVIVISADVQDEAREKVMSLGAVAIHDKELDKVYIQKIIDEALRAKEQQLLDFNQDELDVLNEFINISFGKAASLIANMMETFAELQVPETKIINPDELNQYIHDTYPETKNIYLANQRFKNGYTGESIFLIDELSAENIAVFMHQDEEIAQNDIKAAIIELANIVNSSCVGKFTQLIGAKTVFSPPIITQKTSSDTIISDTVAKQYSKIIMITTILKIEKHEILAYIFILNSDKSFKSLKNAIEKLEEELED